MTHITFMISEHGYASVIPITEGANPEELDIYEVVYTLTEGDMATFDQCEGWIKASFVFESYYGYDVGGEENSGLIYERSWKRLVRDILRGCEVAGDMGEEGG